MKKLVPFIAAIFCLFPALATAGEYISSGDKLPDNWGEETNPVCKEFVNQSQNLVKTARFVVRQGDTIVFFYYDKKELKGVAVYPHEIGELITNPYEDFDEEVDKGYQPIGAVIMVYGKQWLAIAVPPEAHVAGCHYIPLKELPEQMKLAGQ